MTEYNRSSCTLDLVLLSIKRGRGKAATRKLRTTSETLAAMDLAWHEVVQAYHDDARLHLQAASSKSACHAGHVTKQSSRWKVSLGEKGPSCVRKP